VAWEQEKKIKQEMAVGGMVNEPCPPGYVRVGNDCVPAATRQDSIDVMNKAIQLNNFYKNNTGYIQEENNEFDFLGEEDMKSVLDWQHNSWKDEIADNKRSGHNPFVNNQGQAINQTQTNAHHRKPSNPNKPYIIEQRENATHWLNLDAPYGYYDVRITPQREISYNNPIVGDYAEVPMYDPLAVKPHADRTPQEHITYQQRYGNYGGAKTPWNPYAVSVPETKYTQQDLDNAIKQRREQEELEAYNKWYAENPLPEPEPRMNDEMEITYYKPIDMQTKSPKLIPTNDITSNINTGMKYQKESGQGAYPTMSSEEQGMVNKKGKRKYSFGGAILSLKHYAPGGEVANTGNKNTDLALTLMDMFKVMKADKEKYTGKTAGGYKYYRDTEGMPAVNIPDSEIPYDDEGNYDEQLMVKSSKVANTLGSEKQGKGANTQLDYSLPNWGYAKMEQKKLNELIRAEMQAGAKDLELLVEDDIIGENTLKAMNKFEGKGYTRPEGFKDKWLKKYAEDYANGVRMQVPGVTAPLTPKVPGKESVKTTEVKVEEDVFDDFITKTKTEKGNKTKEKSKTTGVLQSEQNVFNFPSLQKIMETTDANKAKPRYTGVLQSEQNTYNFPSLQKLMESPKGESKKENKGNKEESIYFPSLRKAMEESKKEVKEKPKSKYTGPLQREENTMFSPSLKKILDFTNTNTTNNTKRDNQLEQLARDIEAEYETEQKQAYKNFGKKSSAASAENALERAKVSTGYTPISISPTMPIVNKETLPVKKEPSEFLKNAKGQLIATDFTKELKAQKEKKYEEDINKGANNYLKLNLKKSNAKEDVKYNINAISEYNDKIDEALQMLSGTTDTSKQGFTRMTATESRKYNPETRKLEAVFTPVSDEEYKRLTIVHIFLENELDKIYKDPRYKNLSAFEKKRILQRKLSDTQKKLGQNQYEMKKQINDFN